MSALLLRGDVPRPHFMQMLFRIAFWAATVFAFTMAVLPHPPTMVSNDKMEHAAAFAVLAALAFGAFPRLSIVRILILLSLFGAAIEIVQAIPALHRDSDVKDWIADTLAATATLALLSWWRWRRVET